MIIKIFTWFYKKCLHLSFRTRLIKDKIEGWIYRSRLEADWKQNICECSFERVSTSLWTTAAASFLNVRKRLWNTMAHCQSNFNNASHHGWLILNQSRHRVRVCRTVLHCYEFYPFNVWSWFSIWFHIDKAQRLVSSRGPHIIRLIGLSRSFSLISLGFGHPQW